MSKLPTLPHTIKKIYCYSNNLRELPTLPYSLEILNCRDNNLYELPILPDSLEELYCSGNNLPYNNLPEYNKWLEINHPDIFYTRKFNI